MGLDVSFMRRPKLRPEDGIPLNILSQHKMPDMVSAELDRLYRFSKALERDFWEALYDAVHDFLEEHDTFYGAKEVNATYSDVHSIYCMCREVMDTFDWEHFDLNFYADW